MRVLRERTRRGIRRLTIDVSEDDLRAIAKRGYEGAATTDLDQQAQAVGLFLTDALLQMAHRPRIKPAIRRIYQGAVVPEGVLRETTQRYGSGEPWSPDLPLSRLGPQTKERAPVLME
jgi:hypothetical protein